jgi:D-Tyr-tRNAtyr deacylase
MKKGQPLKASFQRVSRAAVIIDGQVVGKIGPGLVVLVGVADGDSENFSNKSYQITNVQSSPYNERNGLLSQQLNRESSPRLRSVRYVPLL